MTEKTLKLLEKSGWSKERNVEIKNLIVLLEREGYNVNDVVEKFLKNMEGIVVVHQHHGDSEAKDKFYFSVERGVSSTFHEVVIEYQERVYEELVVIGRAFTDHMVLMLSHSGKMYAGYDDLLLKLGDTVEDALVALCEGTGITGVE